MICKILSYSGSTFQMKNYLEKEKENGRREGESRAIREGGFRINDIKNWAGEMQDTKNAWGKRDGVQLVHVILSPDPADGDKITPERLELLAADFALKYADEGHKVAWVVHKEGHVHLAIDTISDRDGRRLHMSRADFFAEKKRAEELGKEYGFMTLEESRALRRARGKERPKRSDKEYWKERREGKPIDGYKARVRSSLDEIFADSKVKTEEDFRAALRERKIEIFRETAKSITFIDTETKKKMRGKKLGRDGEYERKHIDEVLQQHRDAPERVLDVVPEARSEAADLDFPAMPEIPEIELPKIPEREIDRPRQRSAEEILTEAAAEIWDEDREAQAAEKEKAAREAEVNNAKEARKNFREFFSNDFPWPADFYVRQYVRDRNPEIAAQERALRVEKDPEKRAEMVAGLTEVYRAKRTPADITSGVYDRKRRVDDWPLNYEFMVNQLKRLEKMATSSSLPDYLLEGIAADVEKYGEMLESAKPENRKESAEVMAARDLEARTREKMPKSVKEYVSELAEKEARKDDFYVRQLNAADSLISFFKTEKRKLAEDDPQREALDGEIKAQEEEKAKIRERFTKPEMTAQANELRKEARNAFDENAKAIRAEVATQRATLEKAVESGKLTPEAAAKAGKVLDRVTEKVDFAEKAVNVPGKSSPGHNQTKIRPIRIGKDGKPVVGGQRGSFHIRHDDELER